MSDPLPNVIIYGTRICGFCMAAKHLCARESVAFEEILLDSDPARRMELARETGSRTVPMIFVKGRFIGGYQELQALVAQGGLQGL